MFDFSGYDEVKLHEDGALAGFVPLMMNYSDPMFTSKENSMVNTAFLYVFIYHSHAKTVRRLF